MITGTGAAAPLDEAEAELGGGGGMVGYDGTGGYIEAGGGGGEPTNWLGLASYGDHRCKKREESHGDASRTRLSHTRLASDTMASGSIFVEGPI